jgi:hypothetical protein
VIPFPSEHHLDAIKRFMILTTQQQQSSPFNLIKSILLKVSLPVYRHLKCDAIPQNDHPTSQFSPAFPNHMQ